MQDLLLHGKFVFLRPHGVEIGVLFIQSVLFYHHLLKMKNIYKYHIGKQKCHVKPDILRMFNSEIETWLSTHMTETLALSISAPSLSTP